MDSREAMRAVEAVMMMSPELGLGRLAESDAAAILGAQVAGAVAAAETDGLPPAPPQQGFVGSFARGVVAVALAEGYVSPAPEGERMKITDKGRALTAGLRELGRRVCESMGDTARPLPQVVPLAVALAETAPPDAAAPSPILVATAADLDAAPPKLSRAEAEALGRRVAADPLRYATEVIMGVAPHPGALTCARVEQDGRLAGAIAVARTVGDAATLWAWYERQVKVKA